MSVDERLDVPRMGRLSVFVGAIADFGDNFEMDAGPAIAVAEVDSRPTQRVLVVDDQADAYIASRDLLERSTIDLFKVDWVHSCVDALEVLRRNVHDAALVDFRLWDGSGLDLIRDARAAGSQVPMILLTGRGDIGTDIDAIQAGATDYLDKGDLSAGILQRAVRLAVERARLRESELLHQAVIEAMAEGVVVFDADGTASHVNPGTQRILGREERTLAGRPLTNSVWRCVALDGSPIRAHDHPVAVTMRTGRPVTNAVLGMTRQDGSRAWISMSTAPIRRGPQGAPRAVVASLADITAVRDLEERLGQSQKMEALGRLAGGIAHDFNNILTAIAGFGSLLLDELPEDDQPHAHALEIGRAAWRAAALIDRLLTFSRRQAVFPRVIDLADALRGMTPMLQRLLGEDVELTLDVADDVRRVRVDPAHFDQIVLNLAANARDAMPDGGRLSIVARNAADTGADTDPGHVAGHAAIGGPAAVHDPGIESVQPGDWVSIVFTDTGTGMDRETLERAFEPFFTTKQAGRGAGLGLATVYGTVEQSAGRVRLEAEPGAGTSVHVYLPATDAGASPAADEPGFSRARGAGTVLVVEDDEPVRALTRHVLAADGYVVIECGDGADAVRAASATEGSIDLVLTDLVLPGMPGTEAVSQIRAMHPGVGVLYMTGYGSHPSRGEHGPASQDPVLAKPFDRARLLAAVRRALETREATPTAPES